MKRGRKEGELQNPRDDRGWMIPQEGTIRRAVYDAMAAGTPPKETCSRLGLSAIAYSHHRQCIVSWRKVQNWRRVAA